MGSQNELVRKTNSGVQRRQVVGPSSDRRAEVRQIVRHTGPRACPSPDSTDEVCRRETEAVARQSSKDTGPSQEGGENEKVEKKATGDLVGLTVRVTEPRAILRGTDLSVLRYQPGEELPKGRKVGQVKIIPVGTEVRVAKIVIGTARAAYALVYAVDSSPSSPLGWTRTTNFGGQLDNIVTGSTAAQYDRSPLYEEAQTVWDPKALIRKGGPGFESTGKILPRGAYVVVLEWAQRGPGPGQEVAKMMGVCPVGARFELGDYLGWTAKSNLKPGWADIFGPTAAWDKGRYLGQVSLSDILGTKGQMEYLTHETLGAYQKMVAAARKESKVEIVLVSGFRSYPEQVELRRRYLAGKGNKAARPGFSKHQNGSAIDLNTSGTSKSEGSGPVYHWLKKHAWRFGFVRTVPSEHWHWEYRPHQARAGRHTSWGR